MGAYRLHGSPLEYVYVTFENGRIKHIECNRQSQLPPEEVERLGLSDAVVLILRKYGICKASPDLRRMTADVVDTKRSEHFITHKYCLVQYTFKINDHEVCVIPHGNAKNTNRPYKKTKASVKRNLEDTLQKTSLAVSQVDSNQGGYKLATNSSNLCHDHKQEWNINHKVKNTTSSFEPLQFGKKAIWRR